MYVPLTPTALNLDDANEQKRYQRALQYRLNILNNDFKHKEYNEAAYHINLMIKSTVMLRFMNECNKNFIAKDQYDETNRMCDEYSEENKANRWLKDGPTVRLESVKKVQQKYQKNTESFSDTHAKRIAELDDTIEEYILLYQTFEFERIKSLKRKLIHRLKRHARDVPLEELRQIINQRKDYQIQLTTEQYNKLNTLNKHIIHLIRSKKNIDVTDIYLRVKEKKLRLLEQINKVCIPRCDFLGVVYDDELMTLLSKIREMTGGGELIIYDDALSALDNDIYIALKEKASINNTRDIVRIVEPFINSIILSYGSKEEKKEQKDIIQQTDWSQERTRNIHSSGILVAIDKLKATSELIRNKPYDLSKEADKIIVSYVMDNVAIKLKESINKYELGQLRSLVDLKEECHSIMNGTIPFDATEYSIKETLDKHFEHGIVAWLDFLLSCLDFRCCTGKRYFTFFQPEALNRLDELACVLDKRMFSY